jgi:hypothetical protein
MKATIERIFVFLVTRRTAERAHRRVGAVVRSASISVYRGPHCVQLMDVPMTAITRCASR